MKRNTYSAASLERPLAWFERTYSLSSEDFYAAYLADDVPNRVSGFHRHVWASFYRDVHRMGGGAFADHAERVLAGA
jgi:hypothetical protein